MGKLLGCKSVDVDIDRGRSGSTLVGVVVSMSSGVSFCSVGGLDEGLGDAIIVASAGSVLRTLEDYLGRGAHNIRVAGMESST